MAKHYVYAIYVSGARVGRKYLRRQDALADARRFRATDAETRRRRLSVRVRRIVDRPGRSWGLW